MPQLLKRKGSQFYYEGALRLVKRADAGAWARAIDGPNVATGPRRKHPEAELACKR